MKSFITIIISFCLAFGCNFIPSYNNNNNFLYASVRQEEELHEEELKEEPKEEQKQEEQQEEQIEEFQKELKEDAPPSESERLKYFKEKYEDTYEKTFEEVWQSVLKSLEDNNCQVLKKSYTQTDEGFYKGTLVSDYCVFTMGDDTTFKTLKKYSIKVPVIRGGVWITGRFQYKFIINERDDGTVILTLKGEVSGFEDYVTGQVHFWNSNGYKEAMMMKAIRRNLNMAVN